MNRIWNSKLLRAARQTRLSTKILVFFIVASVGPLYLLLALDDAANTGILRKQQLENLSSQSVSLASQIQGQLVDWTRSADRLGRAPEVVRLAQGDGSGAADLAATLRGVPATDPSIRVAFVLGLNGQVGASSDPALIGSNDFAQAQFFKLAAQGNPSISDLSVDRGAPVPVLYVSTPVRDPLGHVLAVSALRADPQRIFDFLKPTLLGGSRQGLLLDEHGIVIGASDILKSQVLYHSLGPLNDTERQQMKAAGNFAGQDIPSLGMTDLSEAITAATQTGNTSSYFKPTGQTEVFGFAPVPQNSDSTQVQLPRWTVLVAQPESVFLAPEGQQTRNTATYTTVAALVFVLTIFIVARFFERTERQSLTDSLTGLPNRRYFHEILDRELTRSERTHRALSIINVDLDHFKLVNDEYGHSKGDEILRGFAKVLKDQVRSIDLPVRYGGEEFIVLLPDTDKEGAALVAEKIRRATDRLSIPRLGSMAGRKVTASAGVATFPLDATDGEQLLRCSDQAMYLAKNLGRNQVVAYGTDSGVSSLSKHPERVHLLVQNANKATIEALAAAIDARDTYTHGHSHRVADYARIIASEIEDEPIDAEALHLGALLHDVGKIGVSDSLLRKPGKLTADEYETIKSHAQIGYEMIQGVDFLRSVGPIILHHHENFGGGGYPTGIAGKEIPVESRIIMVSDAFDAMTSTRTYRQAGSIERALEELAKHAGKQFDPDVVNALRQAVSKGKLRLMPQPPPTAAQLDALRVAEAEEAAAGEAEAAPPAKAAGKRR